MEATSFKVVFYGELAEGYTIEKVKSHLLPVFKGDKSKIERFFAGKAVVIKKDIDYLTAVNVQSIFEKAGVICQIEVIEKYSATKAPASSLDIKFSRLPEKKEVLCPEKRMVCPNCGFEQTEAPDCIYCGIDVQQYLKAKVQKFKSEKENITEAEQNLRDWKVYQIGSIFLPLLPAIIMGLSQGLFKESWKIVIVFVIILPFFLIVPSIVLLLIYPVFLLLRKFWKVAIAVIIVVPLSICFFLSQVISLIGQSANDFLIIVPIIGSVSVFLSGCFVCSGVNLLVGRAAVKIFNLGKKFLKSLLLYPTQNKHLKLIEGNNKEPKEIAQKTQHQRSLSEKKHVSVWLLYSLGSIIVLLLHYSIFVLTAGFLEDFEWVVLRLLLVFLTVCPFFLLIRCLWGTVFLFFKFALSIAFFNMTILLTMLIFDNCGRIVIDLLICFGCFILLLIIFLVERGTLRTCLKIISVFLT